MLLTISTFDPFSLSPFCNSSPGASMALFQYLRQSLTLLCFRPKCDEQKPQCRKCITRDAVCIYPPASLVWVGGKAAFSDEGEARGNSCEPSPTAYDSRLQNEHSSATNNPSLNLENIDLIIHWFTTTVHTVNSASNPAALEICQTVILNEAMRHHFLLHGLLAFSALHLADSHSDPQKYTRIAIGHHTQGLALYHSILSNIDADNYPASIAFSSITIMFSFGLSKPQDIETVGMGTVDDLARIFLLAKGWHKVVRAADYLGCTAGSTIFPSYKPSTSTLSTDTEAAFGRLLALNHEDDTALYTLAISSLKLVFRTLAEDRNDNPHVALEWANTLPEEFVHLIRERKSLALAIVGYYCVVLHSVPQVWWLRGWSKGLFSTIWRNIDHVFRDTLEWPRKKIKINV